MNLNQFEFDFFDNKFIDYDQSINEMVFDFGIIATEINISNLNKYLFLNDVNGNMLSINGSRKLAAITCQTNTNNKYNRLIVLDINVDNNDNDNDDDDDDDDDTEKEQGSYSYENEDSDITNLVDID
eukprot:231676_1